MNTALLMLVPILVLFVQVVRLTAKNSKLSGELFLTKSKLARLEEKCKHKV